MTQQPDEAPEAEARRIALELARLELPAEHEFLLADDRFQRAVALLAGDDVDAATVEKLSRDSLTLLAVMAIEAIGRRGETTPEWERWAVRRLVRAGVGETRFLLRTLAEVARTPVLARALGHVDESWAAADLLGDVADFVRARIEAGEALEPAALEQALSAENDDVLTALLDEFDGAPPDGFAEAIASWRRGRVDLDFIRAFARFVDAESAPPTLLIGGRERAVDAIVDALTAVPRRSLLLVGERGAGKTAVALEAFRRLSADGWILFTASAAAVMAGQAYVGELEGRVQELARRTEGREVAWLLPNAEDALFAGQHSRSPRGLLDAMLPYVETGQLALVGEVDPLAFELLVQQRPQVATAFDVVRLSPLDLDESLTIAREAFGGSGPAVAEDTLREAYDLAEHYLPGIAAPGSLVRLVGAARERRAKENAPDVRPEDVLDTLAEVTGLPMHMLDPRTPLDVGAVRAFLAGRVLGQPEAVETLVERIAMIKAALTDPTRPLGVFLFVGPTGTGKTEIAKACAEYLFGSPDRLIRLDMSEFQTPESLERLLADSAQEAQAAPLISSVRKEPFSVVLLDEFEKAHANVWDVFLQVFDDGRLTDQSGRTVDFRHCVIVLTSNLGSALPTTAPPGFTRTAEPFVAASIEREVTRWFAPEFINRLDRVVVFRPLGRDVMRSLLENELSSVLRRRGFRMQPWAVEWDESAIDFLLEKGFSAELGARPLKRAVERYVLAPLALAIVERQFPAGDQFLFITARDGKRLDVTFIDPDAEERAAAPAVAAPPRHLEALVLDPHGEPGEVGLLREETERVLAVIRAEEWVERKASLLASTRDPGFWERSDRYETLALVEYLDRIEAASRTAESLLRRLGGRPRAGARPAKRLIGLLAQRVFLLDRALEGLRRGEAADAFVGVSGDDEVVRALVAMYEAWAAKRGMRSERVSVADDGDVLAISGLAAYTILALEAGVHVFEHHEPERPFTRVNARVAVAPRPRADAGEELASLAGRALGRVARERKVVRRYRREPSPLVRDAVRGWRTGRLDRVLGGDFDVIAERPGV